MLFHLETARHFLDSEKQAVASFWRKIWISAVVMAAKEAISHRTGVSLHGRHHHGWNCIESQLFDKTSL